VKNMLIVDTDLYLRRMVRTYAELELFQCAEAENAGEALKQLRENVFNVVILGELMSDKDGFEVLEEIRKETFIPVIMLITRGKEYNRPKGFQSGIDDYIQEPFSPRELMAKVDAVLRRVSQKISDEMFFGELHILVRERKVLIKDEEVHLSPKEFDILVKFAQNENIVLRREELLRTVWGYEYYGDARTVNTHIRMLREHLGEYGKIIQTVWGVGYRFSYKKK